MDDRGKVANENEGGRSDTAGEQRKASGRPFTRGDPRINRKGRPKSFDALRKEALKIAGEILINTKTGESASIVHAILQGWARSADWQAQKAFIEYAYGKVPQPTEISGDLTVHRSIVELTDDELEAIASGRGGARIAEEAEGAPESA